MFFNSILLIVFFFYVNTLRIIISYHSIHLLSFFFFLSCYSYFLFFGFFFSYLDNLDNTIYLYFFFFRIRGTFYVQRGNFNFYHLTSAVTPVAYRPDDFFIVSGG